MAVPRNGFSVCKPPNAAQAIDAHATGAAEIDGSGQMCGIVERKTGWQVEKLRLQQNLRTGGNRGTGQTGEDCAAERCNDGESHALVHDTSPEWSGSNGCGRTRQQKRFERH
jgi:hypothetical protein